MNGWEKSNRKSAAAWTILQDVLWCLPLPFLMGIKMGMDFYILGPAYYLAMQQYKSRWPVAAAFALIGVLLLPTGTLRIKYGLILLLVSLEEWWLDRKMPTLPFWKRCVVYEGGLGLSVLLLSLTGLVPEYQLISVGLEGALLMAAACLYERVAEGMRASDELSLAAISLVAGTALSAAHGLQMNGLIPAEVLLLSLALTAGYVFGIGKGLALTLPAAFFMRLTYAASEGLVMLCMVVILVVAAFRDLGRIAALIAGFSGGSLWIILMMGGPNVGIGLLSLAMASLIPVAIPAGMLNKLGQSGEARSLQQWRRYLAAQLGNGARAYEQVAELITVPNAHRRITGRDLIYLKEDIASGLCQECENQRICWGKRYAATHDAIVCVMEASRQHGKVQRGDLPRSFLAMCPLSSEFVRTVNRHYELYRLNQSWENRMAQSAKMMQSQYRSVAAYMEGMQGHMMGQLQTEVAMRRNLGKALRRAGQAARDIWVVDGGEREGVQIHMSLPKPLREKNRKRIEDVVSQAVGGRMRLAGRQSLTGGGVRLRFREENRFRVRLGRTGWARDGVSGDSFKAQRLDERRFILALGDGMGSGQKAQRQSERALALLQQLLLTGANEEEAIRQLNTALLLSSQEEVFTTIDLAIINLVNGQLKLVKAGGCITFLRSKAAVYVYHSQSLPVGILGEPEPETFTHSMEEGDLLVMISDGVLDQLPDPAVGERRIKRYLMQTEEEDPQELVRCLARELAPHLPQVEDDRTILALRIEKQDSM